MTLFDHWHPVALSRELRRRRPLKVTLAGADVVLFRDGPRLGALDNTCPHRGFPLHRGRVDAGQLVCPYHGWRWATDGRGQAPGTPTARPCARAWEAVERHGLLWIRRAGSDMPFPFVDISGHGRVTTLRRRIQAPLEVVLDNFTEVEHTPPVHAFLGYPLERMAEVECATTITDDAVTVFNRGPQRRLPAPIRGVFQIPREADFVDAWTTRFSPVHTIYDQYFLVRGSDERRGPALRIAVFYTPVGPALTDLIVLAYASSARWRRPLLEAIRFPMTRLLVRIEVGRDARLLDAMEAPPVVLKGRALGRFDKALTASRRHIARIYRGEGEATGG